MKKTLIVSALMAAALTSFGQGALTWGNNPTGFRAPIYGQDPANANTSVVGQTATGTPAGSAVYGGSLLNGAGFSFAIFAGSTSNSLSLLAQTTFRSSATGALPAGLVLGGTITVPNVAPGSIGFYQVDAWDNKGGSLADWASARTAWLAGTTAAGQSSIQSAVLGGVSPVDGSIIATPNAAGWSSFNIYLVPQVPEPGMMALAGLGAAAMLIMRRRK